ncbi:MAG: hypothetical protein GY903_03040 [Fuerstiella sp.]|nr:hypothetical protein [Fuerstiella sp.]MCP4853450.1 hypothetical protein [Fuerstiella sp.]
MIHDNTVRASTRVLAFGIILISASVSADDEIPKQIGIKQLRDVEIIGALGVPLGKIVSIEATVVSNAEVRRKVGGPFFLRVTAVDGKKLETAVDCEFWVPRSYIGRKVHVAPDAEGFRRLFGVKPGTVIRWDDYERIAPDYVGSNVKLSVFCRAMISGIAYSRYPPPEWYPLGGGSSYKISETLVVHRQLDDVNEPDKQAESKDGKD